MATITITVNPEYERLVPPVSNTDFQSLKQSIKENGLYIPIVINQSGTILDGHHRYRACQELGLEPRTEVKTFADLLSEKQFVIESNLRRRHLNDFQKSELGHILEPIESELAKIRQLAALKNTKISLGSVSLGSNDQNGRVIDKIAEKVGLSAKTYQRAKTIIENAPEELKEKVRAGQTSINYAYKAVKRAQQHQNTPTLPEGKFDIILADPPWEYDINTRGSPDDHYQTLDIESIKPMKVPAANDAILFLWATAPKLQEALDVIRAWGFEYKTHLVWIKDKIGTGYYVRGQHELLLIARKGSIPIPEESNRPPSVFNAPRTEHSKKPDVIYELIEEMYPNRKYFEMFARSKRNRWEGWGLEVQEKGVHRLEN